MIALTLFEAYSENAELDKIILEHASNKSRSRSG